jgi:hypothetical protein
MLCLGLLAICIRIMRLTGYVFSRAGKRVGAKIDLEFGQKLIE